MTRRSTLALLALAGRVSAQTGFDAAKLVQFLTRLFQKNKGMGTLVLSKNGQEVFELSFGYRQVSETGQTQPLTAGTRYRISSITKTYTAAMILQLAEEGKLTLSTTLDRYFPQLPNAASITMEHILAHRSGLPEMEAGGGWALQPRTRDEVLGRIAQGQPAFAPGTAHRYSNSGYNVLGFIVEKIAGKTYAETLQQRIVSRIGLRNTYAGTRHDPNEAKSYRYLAGWQEATEMDLSVPGGAGAILSTASDLAKFGHALFEGKVVSSASLKRMMTIQDGEGMGLEPFTFGDGKTLYGHTGGSGSSGAWLACLPEQKLVLAYLTNAKVHPVRDIVQGALDIYWNRPFDIPTWEAVAVSPELLDYYAGVYTIPGTPARIVITREGSTLRFQPPGQPPVPLEATAPDTFRIQPFLLVRFNLETREMTVERGGGPPRTFRKQQ